MSPSRASSLVDGAPCRSSHTWQAQRKDQLGPHPSSQAHRGEVNGGSPDKVRGWSLGWGTDPHQFHSKGKVPKFHQERMETSGNSWGLGVRETWI